MVISAAAQEPLQSGTRVIGVELIDFELEDQFGEVYSDRGYRQGILVVVGADRGGSQFTGAWSAAIREALAASGQAPQLRMVGLAHTKGVPRFLRGFVRRRFPQSSDSWVLLDWKGVFAGAYGFEPQSANVLVFMGGVLLHQTFGREVEQGKVDDIVLALETALGTAD